MDKATGTYSGTVAVLGAGNGGKAVAADLALQGARVRLFEWQDYQANLAALLEEPILEAEGVVSGEARLEMVSTDLAEVVDGAELVIACLQGLAHERLALELGPHLKEGAFLLLNPGSTGGALEVRRLLAEQGVARRIVIAETGTLTHCSRAQGARGVHIGLRVEHVAFAAFPGAETEAWWHRLRPVFPGLKPKADVLEVSLCNGNPVIHPAIMLGNLAVIERQGEQHLFYAEGVTPAVAKIIEAVDKERMALAKALGYDLMSEPEMCVAQGYASSTSYYECYGQSPVFRELKSPSGVDHRYLLEDEGLGLVTYVSLGDMMGVETPAARSVVAIASAITGRDLLAQGRRTVEKLGLAGMDEQQRRTFLHLGAL